MATEKEIRVELERVIAKAYTVICRIKEQKEQGEFDKKSALEDINRLMAKLKKDSYSFEYEPMSGSFLKGKQFLTCKRIEPMSIVYDAKKVFERIGKKNGKVVVSKKYTVRDMAGLIELLKAHGVPPKEFKKFIDVDYELDSKKLEQLYQTGVIDVHDLDGCYTVQKKAPYWSISTKKQ